MLRGVFVTGTDTGVGKTVVSAALLLRYRSIGPIRYWKPIQTGVEQDDDTGAVEALAGPVALRDGVRLPRPLSPHLAARLSGVRIDPASLVAVAGAQSSADRFIVEGAGGVLVPINESTLMVDLMQQLGLPVIVVARSALGTINHTLLTVEALRTRGLTVSGVVMNGAPNAENRAAIAAYGRVEVIGELPPLDSLNRGTLERAAAALDPEGRLLECFRR